MKFNIHGDKVKITSAIKGYIDQKLGKINKYFRDCDNISTRIVIRVRGKEQIIEATIVMSNFTLRAEEKHSDLYAAIDLVADKIERQIRKNKTRLHNKNFKNMLKDLRFDEINGDEEVAEEVAIVRRKKIEMKPMSEEEALLQIEMLGHDFFVYRDEESDKVNVLYKRKDGNYGVIETK